MFDGYSGFLDRDFNGNPLYYDRDGNAIPTFREYVELRFGMGEDEYDRDRRVASTLVGNVWVSTVWLGMNHNWTGHGPPLIFETMTFPDGDAVETEELDRVCWRYPTEAAALAGHDQVVANVRDLLGVEPIHDYYPYHDREQP